ncbi:hypothetical protein L195_g045604 [Trifolium pratense]|uniref:Sulfate transporter n=1 Tax=Trifolium pratense TaxID=57577 RepID=A0A2K3MFE2_TRIPR|nr:hypothetical protein L195_g045604 [Trifolium pratense]
MGEDFCLLGEDIGSEVSNSSCGEGHVDPEARCNVDMLVNNFTDRLEEDGGDIAHGLCEEEPLEDIEVFPPIVGESGEVMERRSDIPSPAHFSVENSSNLRSSPQGVSQDQVVGSEEHPLLVEAKCSFSPRTIHCKRSNSCPPEARRSVLSGPWSLEWLNDQNHGDAGVIFSARKKSRKGNPSGEKVKKKEQHDPRRRKAGGLLRHPLHSLKKVARMPCNDRREVLKVLKKSVRRRRGGDDYNRSCSVSRRASAEDSSSSVSINNDWMNWVAVQGNDQMAVDDVWGIGKAIGVKFKGDNVNMFNILSRAGKGKKDHSGQDSGGGARNAKGC